MMNQLLAPAEEEVNVEVRWEDQKRIIAFSTNNNRKTELQEEVAALEKKIDDLENAEEELMLADGDDAVMLRLGDGYAAIDEDYATEYIEKQVEVFKGQLAKSAAELSEVEDRLKVLKAELYGRFGKSINLEE